MSITDLERCCRLNAACDKLIARHPINGITLVLCLGMRYERWLQRQLRRGN